MNRTLEIPEPTSGIVFTFPGQGSFSGEILRQLHTSYPETAPHFAAADATARRFFGTGFLPLATTSSTAECERHLAACPDLDQLGIYLTETLIADLLVRRGIRPDLLLGHSFGELAALTTAAVFSIETGLKIVCQRALALQSFAAEGGMASVSCGPRQARELALAVGGSSLQVSVVNHRRQTVLSGKPAELEALAAQAGPQGISLTRLPSRYPFHSSLLAEAVKPFRWCLKACDFEAAEIPVYHSTEGRLWSPERDLADVLSEQFVRPMNFMEIVETLYGKGYRVFVECGAGEIVSKIVGKSLAGRPQVRTLALGRPADGLAAGLTKALELPGGRPAEEPPAAKLETLLARASASLRQVSEVVESASKLVRRDAPGPGLSAVKAADDRGRTRTFPPEECAEVPVAIVAMGCVLPGARNPDEFWRNVVDGRSGIVDLAVEDTTAGRDFMAGTSQEIVADKTYTLLNGAILEVPYDPELLASAYSEEEFEALTRGQKLLALALAQSLQSLARPIDFTRVNVECILGATADGSLEYDEALFLDSIEAELDQLDEPEDLRRGFSRRLQEVWGYRRGDAARLTQDRIYREVTAKLLGSGVATYVLDAACSSSLYSVNSGIKALRTGTSDVVLAGGVFAPGPANNTLFAQFRGLTPHASKPFDADADGVVFGDGAGIVVLKLLPDALASGDRVHAVIRGMGLSSDGKTPSINVPRSAGQILAIRKAYENSGISIDSIQYVEAHATATPVGDAVEFKSLTTVLGARTPELPRISLGSVKALIGHTGWVSGVASIIKLSKAFDAGIVPRQYNYEAPHPDIDLEPSPFTVPRASESWPENLGGLPRRAGINGFGFGGTNAHLILESFDRAYHQNLCRDLRAPEPAPSSLALVGAASLFPAAQGLDGESPDGPLRFDRGELRLPAKKLLLPDVAEHMDPSQYLAALAAEKIFAGLPDGWTRLRDSIGIVLGLASKTERGVGANERIFLDRLRRRLAEDGRPEAIAASDAERLLEKLVSRIQDQRIPSGPYTLPGLMPNVAASRISSLFDLKGPNVVVDRGDRSLFQSLAVARQFLLHGDCRMVLAGGLNAGGGDGAAEAVVLVALTTPETARQAGLPVLGTVDVSARAAGSGAAAPDSSGRRYRGAQGAEEIAAAIRRLRQGSPATISERPTGAGAGLTWTLEPSTPRPAAAPAKASGTHAYVEGTPIRYFTPTLRPAAPPDSAAKSSVALGEQRLLILVDRADEWTALASSGALAALRYRVARPAGVEIPDSVAVDLSSPERLTASLAAAALDPSSYDHVLAVKSLGGTSEKTLLTSDFGSERTFLELLFAVCRHAYDRLRDGELAVSAVCLDAFTERGLLNPHTGLAGGFMKSLARELPRASAKAIHTDASRYPEAFRQVEIELAQADGAAEVCYRSGRRHRFELTPLANLAGDDRPALAAGSVVIATGGARGVTAVLVEEILQRFGATVVALGRTDPESAPQAIQELDEASFERYEAQFYKDEMARDGSQKIIQLKQRYLAYQAVNELCRTTARLAALPGTFEYRSVDINDDAAVCDLVDSIYRRHGRVDMILHGAGVQISQVLTKKSLPDFRRIVATKLGSLSSFYRACARHRSSGPVHFHLLTSAFSYLGNDGQPDYGAANEAMNRLALGMSELEKPTHWSAMAWLGWAGIGMTRGTEFAALAAHRRLRGVTRDEGRKIFAGLMAGRPAAPINVLLADGEIDYYRPAIAPAAAEGGRPAARAGNRLTSLVRPIDISLDNAPYLRDHLVKGVPTLPGAFIIGLAADAAHRLRPELKIVAFEDTSFRRFVRVYESRGARIKVEAHVVSEAEEESVVQVRVLSDFVHKSGLVLEQDIVQTELFVRMSRTGARPPGNGLKLNGLKGLELPDPYVMDGSPVRLNGQFNSLGDLVVGDGYRRADYELAKIPQPQSPYRHLIPNVIMVDAFWRFGTVMAKDDRTLAVYVPEKCQVMSVYFDYTDFDSSALSEKFRFSGVNPREEGDLLHVGPIEAQSRDGRLMLRVEGGVCRKFGEIERAY